MPWQLRMDPEPTEPAEASPEHARALELRRRALNLETLANNPDLAYPECDPKELADRNVHSEYYVQALAAYADLTAHLIEHRPVLGGYREWRHHYDAIDAEEVDQPAEDEDRHR
ncbi:MULTISPECIES: hypothetical protein [Nocardia]|uniref:hypothetical protein n=1 Tax=Nocardia abscessus TaxID=120957 RepID=UPI00245894EE|nr:hypothetical protein [Nocardia abscessus]